MESNHNNNLHREGSITSSEEVDQPEQDASDVGTGRSYECVFCKRGFTTAQALGGHMNIHRKDRAKNRPINVNKHEENNNISGGSRFYQPISSSLESRIHYRTYFPATTSSGRPLFEHNKHVNSVFFDQKSGLFGEDLRMGLSLKFGEDHSEKKRISVSEDDGLDLELRLGHDP